MTNLTQIFQLFDGLNRHDQLLAIEMLVGRLRRAEIDPAEMARQVEDLANEPNLNAPYPIPPGMYTREQLEPRGER